MKFFIYENGVEGGFIDAENQDEAVAKYFGHLEELTATRQDDEQFRIAYVSPSQGCRVYITAKVRERKSQCHS